MCYSWEMALNVGLEVSFNNTLDHTGIRDKEGEGNSVKIRETNEEISLQFSADIILSDYSLHSCLIIFDRRPVGSRDGLCENVHF
jgi:hypothetical protein